MKQRLQQMQREIQYLRIQLEEIKEILLNFLGFKKYNI